MAKEVPEACGNAQIGAARQRQGAQRSAARPDPPCETPGKASAAPVGVCEHR